jgi:peroxiredoxin
MSSLFAGDYVMAFTLDIGKPAPDFALPATDGKTCRLADLASAPLLLISFTCNHCPYVIGNETREKAFVDKYAPRGLAYVAINSNDVNVHAEDDFPHMQQRARRLGFTWSYLYDESQAVAKAYGAIKTPHFFLFDQARILRYVGRMDNNPRDASQAHTHELADAVDALLAGKPVPQPVTDALGCTVKWRHRDPHFIPTDVCDLV